MKRIAAILCTVTVLLLHPVMAALGQEPNIAIPVGAAVQGSRLVGEEGGDKAAGGDAAGGQRAEGEQTEGGVPAEAGVSAEEGAPAESLGTTDQSGETQASDAPAAVQVAAPSVVLMEASTGQIIFEKGGDEKRSPASVTKVMTLILIFDALQSGKINLTDEVVTSAHAKSMGGSQVFLDDGDIIGLNQKTF